MVGRSLGLVGVCNAIVDLYAHLTDEQLAELGFTKTSYAMQSRVEQEQLIGKLPQTSLPKINGGSVANSVVTFAQAAYTGGEASSAMFTSIGSDAMGDFYREASERLGIVVAGGVHSSEATGTCVVCVTPDAERTMRTYLGAALHLEAQHIDDEFLAKTQWVFLEGYVLVNPNDAGAAVARRVVAAAKAAHTKIALTCSDAWVVGAQKELFAEILPFVDLLFANESEAMALTGAATVEEAINRIADLVPFAVVTRGGDGVSVVRSPLQPLHVPAVACNPVDLTGAGDSFAGAFLWALTKGATDKQAATLGCEVAGRVIQQLGPRLQLDEVLEITKKLVL